MSTRILRKTTLTLIVGVLIMAAAIAFQVYLASRSVARERAFLAETNSMLVETRALLASLQDEYVHPTQKLTNLNHVLEKLKQYDRPRIAGMIPNPLGLKTVAKANARKLALRESSRKVPVYITETEGILNTLLPVYAALENFFAYNPHDDLQNRYLTQNQDEFTERLNRASRGLQQTVGSVATLDLPEDNKREIIEEIKTIQLILGRLQEANTRGDTEASDHLRNEFIASIFPAQERLDIKISALANYQSLLEDSRSLSVQIESALH